jgi:hypothetical protein
MRQKMRILGSALINLMKRICGSKVLYKQCIGVSDGESFTIHGPQYLSRMQSYIELIKNR